ncbi:hypothetical protein HPB47_006862 [Ixodes persulcatus]|uniref:Uncharacterized protein n=1 Tax=Ixodes persulcatus TaxID=34615 RepID=A0AC60P901_IXOPE|nr:hypothetical protein HPB47_006862 [Ixodes persulcatus]
MPPKKSGASIKIKGSTSPEKKEAKKDAKKETKKEVSEQAVSREVFKPAQSMAQSKKSVTLDTEELASFLEGPATSPTAHKGALDSENSTGNKADDQGDVKLSTGSSFIQEPLPPGTRVVSKTERHRVITDEIGNGAPQRPPDSNNTTTTSFEAHVRMQMSLPRTAATTSAGSADATAAGGLESCRCRGPSRPRCPDCGQVRDTRDCTRCCSSSTASSDSYSQDDDDDADASASTLASSACSSCHSEIGTMMHSSASG